MTASLDERARLMAGADIWRTRASEALNLRSLMLSDGPNGVRGDFVDPDPAMCFPVGVALGASWNSDLLADIGADLAIEAQDKGVDVVLGPNVNLQRTPIGGRNFECYSEDPFLSGVLGTSYVQALQAKGIGACPKHFVANDQEYNRHTIDIQLDENTLHSVFLMPFRMIVEDAAPWMIMGAYNSVNGAFCCANQSLVQGVLRDSWGFDGVYVSDWGAALDTVENATAGLDLEMPGPGRAFGPALVMAVQTGAVEEARIDESVMRLKLLSDRTAAAQRPKSEQVSIDRPEHRALARRAAADGMVLLKDQGILPLDPSVSSIAVLGPNADNFQIMGGGSSFVLSHPYTSPLSGIKAAFPKADVTHHRGCANNRYAKLIGTDRIEPDDAGKRVFTFTQVDDADENAGITSSLETSRTVMINALDGDAPTLYRISGRVRVERGNYEIGLMSAGRARLMVNGLEVIDNWNQWEQGDSFFRFGSTERRASIAFNEADIIDIEIDYERAPASLLTGVQFGLEQVERLEEIEEATRLAANADIAILVLGSDADWESEGHDRASMELPGRQNQLVTAVLEANPNTVIVMNVGSATSMPWYDAAPSVLVTWFPGTEGAKALADVLSGRSDPGGRLPFSWPKYLTDHPAMNGYGESSNTLVYPPGCAVGHRDFKRLNIDTQANFGAGKTYGQISVENVCASDDRIGVDVVLLNSSNRPGHTLLTVFGAAKGEAVLCGFKKVAIKGGQRAIVTLYPELHRLAQMSPYVDDSLSFSFEFLIDGHEFFQLPPGKDFGLP